MSATTSHTPANPPLPEDTPDASFQPPLPDEPAPEPTPSTRPAPTVVEDVEDALASPSNSKGKGKQTERSGDEDEQEEWDPSATDSKSLADRKAVEEKPTTTTAAESAADTGGWQAVWAPAQNAYYFWNANTGAVQWENPLAPPPEPPSEGQPPLPAEPAPSGSWNDPHALPATTEAALPPIDPALAHLLPASQRPGASTPADAMYQSAQFNARTGRFTPRDYAFTVDHLAEANRAKRQEMAYFDVAAWEREREEDVRRKREREESGEDGARKLTKKDMERFRAKKQERKKRNQAWLRE